MVRCDPVLHPVHQRVEHIRRLRRCPAAAMADAREEECTEESVRVRGSAVLIEDAPPVFPRAVREDQRVTASMPCDELPSLVLELVQVGALGGIVLELDVILLESAAKVRDR